MLQNCLPVKAIWDLNLIPIFSYSLGGVSCHTGTRALSCNEHEEECSWGWKLFSLSHARSWWFPKPWPRPWIYGDLCPAEQPLPLERGAQPAPAGARAGKRGAKSDSRFLLTPAWRADPCKCSYFIYPFIWRIRSPGSWECFFFQLRRYSSKSEVSPPPAPFLTCFFWFFFFYFFGWKQQMDKCVDKQ